MASSAADRSRSPVPSTGAGDMEVVVTNAIGETVALSCHPYATIDNVKTMVLAAMGVPVDAQLIISEGVVCQGGDQLAGLKNGGRSLYLHRTDAIEIMIEDRGAGGVRVLCLQITRNATVADLLRLIEARWSSPVMPELEYQGFFLASRRSRTVSSYGVRRWSVIRYSEAEVDEDCG